MGNASSILPITGTGLKITRNKRVLLNVKEIELGRKGITCILGHNGAGKSLLIKVLTGLVRPDEGHVRWNGEPVTRAGYLKLGYMKQNAVLLRRSAKANIEFPLLNAGWSRRDGANKAEAALEAAGLGHIAQTSARVLSGGERQRLSLARMLVVEPEVIILDEPTASLDPESTAAIEAKIKALKNEGKPIILVTHNLNQARRLADDIIFLHQARIFAHQQAKSFFDKPACEEARRFILE